MFALTAASMGFAIYGPPILQQLRGFSPLWAGYAIGAESAGLDARGDHGGRRAPACGTPAGSGSARSAWSPAW